MRQRVPVLFILLFGWLTGAAEARTTFYFYGDIRRVGMGGAALAIVKRTQSVTADNPVYLAFHQRPFALDVPNTSFRTRGIGFEDTLEYAFRMPDTDDAIQLGRDFGDEKVEIGIRLGWGFRFGRMGIQSARHSQFYLTPDAAFREWVKTGQGDLRLLPASAQADARSAAVLVLPSVNLAQRITPAGSRAHVEVGARIQFMRAFYSHHVVRKNTTGDALLAQPAPEIPAGRTVLSRDGVSVDLGFLIHPHHHHGFSGAIVVTNALDTPFRFDGTDASGAPKRYDLHPRSVSLGTAWEDGRALLALDVVDITASYDSAQIRFGAEYMTKGLAYRAGYSSAGGFVVGIGWKFVHLAFGGSIPLQVSQALHF